MILSAISLKLYGLISQTDAYWKSVFQALTIAICNGVCQGHKGMRYPLSRDLIADSVEMAVETHNFDAMLLPGCDKIILGMLMAIARRDIPTVVVSGCPMLPGNVGPPVLLQ